MSVSQTDNVFQVVETDQWRDLVAPDTPPPRRPPPPDDSGDDGRFDEDDEPQGSRLNNAHLGLLISLVAETMLFAGLMGAFIIVRVQDATWPQLDLPRPPLFLPASSTVVLLLSAYTMHKALHALRSWTQLEGARFLALTVGLGGLFLALQSYEWSQLIRFGMTLSSGITFAPFFLLLLCHTLHVASGLIWMITVWFRTQQAEDCLTRPVGISICSLYWFYVVALWPLLYGAVYLF